MVVVLLDNLQQVNHIPVAGDLFPSHLIIGDTVDKFHQLLLVLLVTILQLLANIAKYGVLVGGITEDGSVVIFQLALQLAKELEVGELVLFRIEELSDIFDRTVGPYEVVRELECHLFVWIHPFVHGQGDRCGLEVNHVQREMPILHLSFQAGDIDIDSVVQVAAERR